MKKTSSTYIRILISIGLLFVLFFLMRGKYTQIFEQLKKTSVPIFAVAFLTYTCNIIINTFRLDILLKGEKLYVPFKRIIELSYIGFFFNNFMPSSLGGDIIKGYYLGKSSQNKAKAYIAVFVDRLTGLFTFAFMGGVALWLNKDSNMQQYLKDAIVIFILICIFIALVTLNKTVAIFISNIFSKLKFKNLGHKLTHAYEMIHSYSDKKSTVLKAMACSFFGQISYFSVVYILFMALGIHVSFKTIFLIMPMISVIGMIPSLGGLGVREGGIVALFGPIAGVETAFGVSILLFLLLFILSTIGGFIYLISPQFRGIHLEDETLV